MYCITERSALFSLVIGLGTIGVGEGGQGQPPLLSSLQIWKLFEQIWKYSGKHGSEGLFYFVFRDQTNAYHTNLIWKRGFLRSFGQSLPAPKLFCSPTAIGTHLFVKVPRPGDSEGTFLVVFESSCHLFQSNHTKLETSPLSLGTHFFHYLSVM